MKVVQPNLPVDFLFSPMTPATKGTVFFLAENVVIPGKSIKEKTWDFGDGEQGCCENKVTHVYKKPGNYTAKFILKDHEGNSYEKAKKIVVADPRPPTIVITAQDFGNLKSADSGSTYFEDRLPAMVQFDLNKSTSLGLLKEAVWNFGDGNKGFGLNPSWTYYKNGNYSVQVTATDEHGMSASSSINIQIKNEDCIVADGHTGCLILGVGNLIIPTSSSNWTMTHDQGALNFVPAPTDTSWVHLSRHGDLPGEDPSDPRVGITNIGDAVTVSGRTLTVNTASVISKGIDLTKSYKVIVATDLTNGKTQSSYYSEFENIYFGIGTLSITANEPGIRFFLEGTTSGYKKYVELGNRTSLSIADLPAEFYSLSAEKGNRKHTYNVEIKSKAPVSIGIDLSEASLKKMEAEWQKEIDARKAHN